MKNQKNITNFMKNKYKIFVSLFIPIVLLSCVSVPNERLNNQTINIITMLMDYNYSNLAIDNNSLIEIKKNSIINLDPSGLFFINEDVMNLCSIDFSVEELQQSASFPFFDKTAACYRQRLIEAQQIISDLSKTGMDYSTNETINFPNRSDIRFAENKAELAVRWEKRLKYDILSRLYKKAGITGAIDDYKHLLETEEPNIRSSVISREERRIQDILNYPKRFRNVMTTSFYDALVSRFDPHSSYISLKEIESYKESMSPEAHSYGVYFRKNIQGNICIDSLIPGGPAWKSAKLNKDDIVMELSFPTGNGETIDASDLDPEEINKIINSGESDLLTITVKKANGLIERVSIKKEKCLAEENTIAGFILNGKKKIGYIYLPAFYTEWETPGIRGCANDVAKEILKLKKEKIEGLILDLRDNGGGALIEAMELAGIFIDEGPICIKKTKEAQPVILKDPDRGSVYDGPVEVMVNGQSASASEIFVAAMKNYNRAVIVGSRTFGKASGQVLLPIVSDIHSFNSSNRHNTGDSDYLKLTIELLYDLNGNTHQISGIIPDVILPDLFEDIYKRESVLDYAIVPDKIDIHVPYDRYKEIPREELSKKSERRIAENPIFRNIKSMKSDIKKFVTRDKDISLNIDDFFRRIKTETIFFDSIGNKVKSHSSPFDAGNSAYDSEIIRLDDYKKISNDRLIEQITGDAYIGESYNIICDYINSIIKQEEK